MITFLKRTIVTIAIIATFSSLTASAQTPNLGDLRLTTSPLPINLRVNPGETVTAQLKVKNDGVQDEKIKVTLMKFKANGNTGAPLLLDREESDSYFDWVTFSEPTFTLPSNEWKTITATFNVSKEASFGYYYAVIFSRADEKVAQAERQTVIAGGTATLVLLEVQSPNAKRQVEVTNFSVDKAMYEFLPATFSIELRNTGNVHIAPKGNIFISKDGKTDVAILQVNSEGGSILPDSPRIFEKKWADGFPVFEAKKDNGVMLKDASGQQVTELKWDFKDASKLRFGKYTAKLLLVYDDGQRDVPIEGSVSFWVIPWRLIAIFVVNFALIAGLILYVIRLRRRLKMVNRK